MVCHAWYDKASKRKGEMGSAVVTGAGKSGVQENGSPGFASEPP